ncbi:hypothetical protein AKJ37_00965 [candidate division MSBL1 archaeon SCGC-AAA259I09]|uniref:SEC-C domain-containing protein n=2 Tax=candidate division MSBL1 TaxID=215777 RepID=A0A133UTT9_9EURY|nr:hypothetical protein AKJ38_00875 [candidate division MSBL1 archaeon SCGC-AAA259I14]KXA98191.1 hypothetical protein AKJ37_00965 [candidate division MSBL1 archaeon SCGC-AAA259I09]
MSETCDRSIDLSDVEADPELVDLWERFVEEYEDGSSYEEIHQMLGKINGRLQDLFNDHDTDVCRDMWEYASTLRDAVRFFAAEKRPIQYECRNCGSLFFYDDDGRSIHIEGLGESENGPKERHRRKIGRNDPCPCGSGKKFKKCCGDPVKQAEREEKMEWARRSPQLNVSDYEEIKEWEGKISAAENADELREIIEGVCEEEKPPVFYRELGIGGVIYESEAEFIEDGDREGYYDLLHSLKEERPDVFKLDLAWYVRDLIHWHILQGNHARVEEAANWLIGDPQEEPDLIFDLIDTLAMNGFPDLAREIAVTHYPVFKEGDSMTPGGLEELSTMCGYFSIARFIEKDETFLSEEFERLEEKLYELDFDPDKAPWFIDRISTYPDHHGTWTIDYFWGEVHSENLQRLFLDFVGYLSQERGANPVEAFAMRLYAERYIHREWTTDLGDDEFFHQLSRTSVENHLERLLNPPAAYPARAYGTLCALRLLYDFLEHEGLVGSNFHDQAMSIITENKRYLERNLPEEEIEKCKFAEKWTGDLRARIEFWKGDE